MLVVLRFPRKKAGFLVGFCDSYSGNNTVYCVLRKGKEVNAVRRYKVETLVEGTVKYYFIRDCETLDIVYFPSKYLKYKIKSHRSPKYRKNVRPLRSVTTWST